MYENRGTAVSQEIIDAKKAELGLDQPFLVQYVSWLNGFLHGDMGTSYVSGKKVFDEFVSKLPATLLLTVMSILATVVISIPLGVLAAENDVKIDKKMSEKIKCFCGFSALSVMRCRIFLWRCF